MFAEMMASMKRAESQGQGKSGAGAPVMEEEEDEDDEHAAVSFMCLLYDLCGRTVALARPHRLQRRR